MNQLIEQIIGKPESDELQYKAVLPPARSLAQMISAFANTNGGVIILGVAEANGRPILNGLSEDFQANSVTHKAIDMLSPKPAIDYGYITHTGKRLYVVEVEKSTTSILFEGKLFIIRQGRIMEENPIAPANLLSRPQFIESLATQIHTFLQLCTGSKKKFLEHYLGIVNIISDLKSQLFPNSANIVTSNAEGRILTRILFSSSADNFETYLSDLLYEIYLANPQTLKSSQQVTVKEVLDCLDMEDFVMYYAKKKLSKLQRGSVKAFISENSQIKSLNVLGPSEEEKIEKMLQIRHLYAHSNGIIDEKFLQNCPGNYNLNDEHKLSIIEVTGHMSYLCDIVDKLDNAAVQIFSLATI